jgi:glycosyltransferase involved in cell wall biosynthesis
MDYWPNIDAVNWFASEILQGVQAKRSNACFYIVGMNPAPAVKGLSSRPGVVVTGAVPDVRPYLQHAAVVVAPLRVARGVQSKVLEAMAMARPVVVSSTALSGISGVPGRELEVAGTAEEFVHKVLAVLDAGEGAGMGTAARARIRSDYSWERNLAMFDGLLNSSEPVASRVAS